MSTPNRKSKKVAPFADLKEMKGQPTGIVKVSSPPDQHQQLPQARGSPGSGLRVGVGEGRRGNLIRQRQGLKGEKKKRSAQASEAKNAA